MAHEKNAHAECFVFIALVTAVNPCHQAHEEQHSYLRSRKPTSEAVELFRLGSCKHVMPRSILFPMPGSFSFSSPCAGHLDLLLGGEGHPGVTGSKKSSPQLQSQQLSFFPPRLSPVPQVPLPVGRGNAACVPHPFEKLLDASLAQFPLWSELRSSVHLAQVGSCAVCGPVNVLRHMAALTLGV